MIEVIGKNGISCKVIADSISEKGIRMTTFEWVFNRWILAEINTHRSISKNLQSSRAVPLKKAIEMVKNSPAYPTHWGKNQAGMQAKEELAGDNLGDSKTLWDSHREVTISVLETLDTLGAHKQWAARILEPHVMTKGVFSGTDWSNLMYLRDDEEAQPEFQELARCVRLCFEQSVPTLLYPDEWHVPYVKSYRNSDETVMYFDSDDVEIDVETAKKISGSCCAQVSYRRLNDSREKALEIYDKLFSGRKPHMSPVEHQATPIFREWENGVTHIDRNGNLRSGNLNGWIQYRQTLPNNAVLG
jgi:hypothetical protein